MRNVFLVLMVFYGAGTAAAQESAPCKGRNMPWMETLADSIGITPEQRAQIDAIQAESCRKVQAAIQAAGGNPEQAKPAIQALRKETRVAVHAVLTPAQRSQQAQMRSRSMESRQHGAGHFERWKDSLNLTESQLTAIRAIREDAMRRSKEAIAAAGGDREAAKAQLKNIRSESKEKTMALLTPEQRERWKTIQASKKPQRSPEEKAAMLTERMMEQLQLNETQVVQINALHLSIVNQRRALKEKAGQGATEAELKPLRQAMMRDYKTGLSGILTPAQQETLRSIKEGKRAERGKPHPVKP
jgi:Spy/CpxP family protein refolding chaperone